MIKAKELANKTKDENLSNKKLINQKINIVHNNNIEKKKKNVSFSDKSLIKISYNQNEKLSQLKICDKTNKKANFNLKNMKNYKKILSSNKPKSINYETLSKNSRNRKLTNYNNTYNGPLNKINNMDNTKERKKSLKKDIKDSNVEKV